MSEISQSKGLKNDYEISAFSRQDRIKKNEKDSWIQQ
jgi:hypothetical protein